jgi:ubiquinone/menaquinone biosynthesis C-methylase UbiE
MENKTSHLAGDPCPYWLAWTLDNPIRRAFHNPRQILDGLVTPGQTVLDLGCGPGFFTLAMAGMVGERGRVIAVDVQPQMLAYVRARAQRQGLAERVTLHQVDSAGLGLETPLDFALAFYMLHEVPDRRRLIGEISRLLKPGGRFLLVEPRLHVVGEVYRQEVEMASAAGMLRVAEPRVRLSRATLFRKPLSGA